LKTREYFFRATQDAKKNKNKNLIGENVDYSHYQRCYTVDKGILDSCVEARRFVSVEIYTFSIFSRGININRVVARLASKKS
jgi:hypothetical protein